MRNKTLVDSAKLVHESRANVALIKPRVAMQYVPRPSDFNVKIEIKSRDSSDKDFHYFDYEIDTLLLSWSNSPRWA